MAFLPIFAATVAGAIAGHALSFWAGVRWKQQIRIFWPFSRYTALMDRGEQFISRHGGKSIFIVRFIPGVKAVVPTIAGMMGMTTTRFALVNVGSAFLLGRGASAACHRFGARPAGCTLRKPALCHPRGARDRGRVAGLGFIAPCAGHSDPNGRPGPSAPSTLA
jgi:hypothetical protein